MHVEQDQPIFHKPEVGSDVPLVVDLDGTLIAADILAEAMVSFTARRPGAGLALFKHLRSGKQVLKSFLVDHHMVDPATLPYRPSVLALIAQARGTGRPVYLATASHERYADLVASYLRLFDGVLATNATRNLAGKKKAELLVERFGEGGFDYVGDSGADLAVWRHARRCYTVGVNGRIVRQIRDHGRAAEPLSVPRAGVAVWLRGLRVHQYAKNALIFLPVIAGHALHLRTVAAALLAFLAFSLAASAVYLVNDMIDVADDRAHPTKKHRPLASGLISIRQALTMVALLLLSSAAICLLLPPLFALVLGVYLVLTTAYSVWLKRKMLIDVVVLSLLYNARVCAGGAATHIILSSWLLAFCLFVFTSLALIKRYTELLVRIDRQLPDASNRNYRKDDLPVIVGLAAATGCNAVTVLALYIASPEVTLMYAQPQILWLLCPLLLFLMSRTLLVAHRRQMHDDPVVWAMRDRTCRIGIAVAAAIVIGAVIL